jgi:hypothetical protein
MNQKTKTLSTHLLPARNDNLERIASSLEALVGIQREMMAELYGLRAVADELFEIERVRWLQESGLAYTTEIKKLEDGFKSRP